MAFESGSPASRPGERPDGGSGEEGLYEELWRACAGPLVEVPLLHERVFYFPQGHMEQLVPSTDQESDQQIPLFNLPSKILCRVVNIELRAEPETDEVYAQITLLPEADQSEPTSPDPCLPEPLRPSVHSFCKILTASDTSTHGGFSVLRRHATECLPPLDMSQPTPTRELAAKDLHGFEWRFKHIFRGQPRRHLLTTGWSTYVTCKRLVAGDVFIFMRGENEELHVGVRRLARQQNTIPSSVISSQSMHLGVLATASHAVSTHSLFTVFYKPRISQFIVRVNKYLEAFKNGFAVGMRFKMRFEGEDVPEKRVTGTITGVGDISSQWASSKWRSLKVQWDEASNIQRPERISPWDIEPLTGPMTALSVSQPVFMKNKRSRSSWDLSGFEAYSGFRYTGKTQSLEVGAPDAQTSETQVLLPQRPKESNDSNFLKSHSPHDTILADCWLKDLQSPVKSSSSSMTDVSLKLFEGAKGETKAIDPSWPHLSSCLNEKPSLWLCSNIEKWKKPESSSTCRLFGIDLVNPSSSIERATAGTISLSSATDEDPLQATTATLEDSDRHSGLSKAPKEPIQGLQVFPKEIQNNQNCSTRSRTKVHMQGIAVGRAVDLTYLEGYDDLILELEQMFEIEGELHHRNKWEVVYTDDEGDMMLVGDDPWPEFCKMVKKISIYTSEEVKKMRPRSKFPEAPTSEGEGGGGGAARAAALEEPKIESIQN
ncbi:auxin response factor 18-like isoform X2 [Phoenix dactylifera]|uniref:Auxin response factor n=1 Tax=Phoenix dactylifera TaxID=42345 RepID=A0A8B9AKA7_PHODC|nr:auxin response factor 18-like isoform X2 [Phoenix dactylifera]